MGNSFLTYSAKDNNCQNFILAILQSNGLLNSRNELFTKQSTDSYFSDDLRKFTSTITDIGVQKLIFLEKEVVYFIKPKP